MSAHRNWIVLSATVVFVVAPCAAINAGNAELQAFQEKCSGNPIKHKQAVWRCTNRPYASAEQLISDLKDRTRNKSREWELADSDPVFNKAQGLKTWWDCQPGKAPCGYWIRYGAEQFIFVQQLLDRSNNNAWLGLGITTFCGGPKATCERLTRTATLLLDPAVDFNDFDSSVGSPPYTVPAPAPRGQ